MQTSISFNFVWFIHERSRTGNSITLFFPNMIGIRRCRKKGKGNPRNDDHHITWHEDDDKNWNVNTKEAFGIQSRKGETSWCRRIRVKTTRKLISNCVAGLWRWNGQQRNIRSERSRPAAADQVPDDSGIKRSRKRDLRSACEEIIWCSSLLPNSILLDPVLIQQSLVCLRSVRSPYNFFAQLVTEFTVRLFCIPLRPTITSYISSLSWAPNPAP